ncbi:MAG: N-acetylneuraminate synthase [Lachnospiraceae bacterium]|jgi:N,N'-diacetyllegionaminate synthase|nr:N-acetylneuraminate synthase [Lachnospiraceae bacterium]
MSVYIIAEAGVNHNGSYELACKMVDAAKAAGVDCIKFQTFKSKNLVAHNAQKAEYQKDTTGDGSQVDMLKKLELSYDEFAELKAYCDKVGIMFLSTPFDFESINFLNSIDMPFWKIPSGEITNFPYLVALAKTEKPVIMSTGMCEMGEINAAIEVLRKNGTTDIKLLHCNTEYPTPFEDVNLRAMQTMRDAFNLEVGYSDHTKGIDVPAAAVAIGATVIEKHFTLDRNMEGPDHKASLEPDELADMVSSIRNIEKALGTGDKTPSTSERKNIAAARKSIVAKHSIRAGEVLSDDNITVKRPGTGISPMQWNDVIGTKAIRNFDEDELIEI